MTPQKKKALLVIVVLIAIAGTVIFLKKKSDKQGGLFATRPKYDKTKPVSISNRPGANLD